MSLEVSESVDCYEISCLVMLCLAKSQRYMHDQKSFEGLLMSNINSVGFMSATCCCADGNQDWEV